MKNLKPQIKEWNIHYSDLNNLMYWPSEALIRSLYFLKKKIKKNINILDYGCGNGRNSNFFKLDNYYKKKNIKYYGYDISNKAIEIAKKNKKKNYNFHNYILKKKYKLIMCIAVLDQLLESQRINSLKQIHNLMTKNSYLIIDVLTKNKHIRLQGLGKKIEKDTYIINSKVEKGIYQYFYQPKDLLVLKKKFNLVYEENYKRQTKINNKLTKFYTRTILILKKK